MRIDRTPKNRKKSYMKQYFLKIFFLITILVGVLVLAISQFSKKVTGDEIINLHSSILNQSVHQSAQTISDLRGILEKFAENGEIVDWIAGELTDTNRVDEIVRNEIYGNFKKGNRFRIYVYDLNSFRYASDYPEVEWEVAEQVIRRAEQSKKDASDKDIYVEGPILSGTENGLYRHSYYMVQPIRNLLNREKQGYVLMQISEVVLYDTFSKLIANNRDYCIADADGIVLSARNKKNIGKKYEKNDIEISNREPLGAGYGISAKHPDYVYFYENISGTSWYLIENVDFEQIFAPLRRASVFSLSLVVIFIMCTLLVTIFLLKTVLRPIEAIKYKMSLVAGGAFRTRISEGERGKGELSEIADSFNYMVEELENQVEVIRTIERKKHLLELDFLQTQINPHFIHNTLSSIRFYVEMGKYKEAEKMLIDFSQILKKTLSSSEKFISLKEELETLVYYIELQEVRYRDRFKVEFDVAENTLPCIVPDFIMQPIVENAIFYSLEEKKICHIQIRSYIEHHTLYVSVKDDGVGMDENKVTTILEKGMQMNKVGLRNVNERLKLNFGEEYGIRIRSEEGAGTEVIMKMPQQMRGGDVDEDTDSR